MSVVETGPTVTETVSSFSIRLARPDEGETVLDLMQRSGAPDIHGLNWTDIGTNWILVHDGDYPVGCMQVLPGMPIGVLQMMYVDKATTRTDRAKIVKRLLIAGCELCRRTGSSGVAGFLAYDNVYTGSYGELLKHRGAVKWFTGDAYLKRV